MTSYCTIHAQEMSERASKTKFDAQGNPKTYFAHTGPDGKLCFGESFGKAERTQNTEGYQKFKETGEAIKKEVNPEEPMGKKDWERKEFIKGLGVFSSAARSEGMTPAAAARDMHIFDWMRVAYGDSPYYDEWVAGVKERIKEVGE